MTWLLAACWLAAIIAMAFGREYLSATFFVVGFVVGVCGDSADQRRRKAAAANDRLMREIWRHR